MSYQIYCLYASLKGEEPSPWLIAAEDEFAWEGDPERCQQVFAEARDLAARNAWDVRELVLNVDIGAVARAFHAAEVPATVEAAG